MESPLIIMASGPAYEGFLVIDSLFHERSAGGVRIASDMTLDEVCALAREMTLKYALFHLPRGGSKAGLRIDEYLDPTRRREALVGFGRQIGPLIRAGIYSPGTDMNCGLDELRAIYEGVGLPLGRPTDTSFYTAIGLADAIRGCAEGLNLPAPVTLAIEGFGSVANHLAAMLPPPGFRITAISTVRGAIAHPEGFAVDELKRQRAAHGDDLVHHLTGTSLQREELLAQPVDILVPAARTGTITMEVAARIRARAVVPAANAPYRPGTIQLLADRGVLCLPGYLCNAGGVFGSSLADNGVPLEAVKEIFRTRYRPLIRTLVEMCPPRDLCPVSIVEKVAVSEAELRARRAPIRPLMRKLWDRMSRRFPAAFRRRAILRLTRETFDAMDRAFRKETA
jgi:glutamate dehydrogenase/leucine dehydrogenase